MIHDGIGTAFILGNLERDLQYNHLLKNYVCLAALAAAAPGQGFARKVLVQKWTWLERKPPAQLKAAVDAELHRFERFQLAPGGDS